MKFNHLAANCLIFYNVQVISEVLEQLNLEGAELDEQAVGALSPYLRQHFNRFGEYLLDLTRPPHALNYDIQVITTPAKRGTLRATLPVFTGGDAAVVRGVRADRCMAWDIRARFTEQALIQASLCVLWLFSLIDR